MVARHALRPGLLIAPAPPGSASSDRPMRCWAGRLALARTAATRIGGDPRSDLQARAEGPQGPGEAGARGLVPSTQYFTVPCSLCRRASGGGADAESHSARICRCETGPPPARYQRWHDRVSHPAKPGSPEPTVVGGPMRCGELKEAPGGTMRLDDPAGRSFSHDATDAGSGSPASIFPMVLSLHPLRRRRPTPSLAGRWRCAREMEKQERDLSHGAFCWNLCLPPERVGRSSFPA